MSGKGSGRRPGEGYDKGWDAIFGNPKEKPAKRSVSELEFKEFIKNHPRKLERDVIMFCDPPTIQYNDFTLGKWPDSVVAQHSFSDIAGKIPSDWKIIRSND